MDPTATGTDPEHFGHILSGWCRLHGFVSLELGGNFASMGVDADTLFRREVEALLRELDAMPERG